MKETTYQMNLKGYLSMQPTSFDNVNIDSVELMWEFPDDTVDN